MAQSRAGGSHPSKPVSVLLVDDNAKAVDLLGYLLECHGFEVTKSRTVVGALAALESKAFDAVVTDMVFDGSLDGSAVVAAASKLAPEAAVILMTGYPGLESAVGAMRLGAMDYLQKPVEANVLAAKIEAYVRRRRFDPEQVDFPELVEILSEMVAHTIERIDPYTAGHGERTRSYCDLVAADLGVDAQTRERLALAAVAHDYGKIYLEDLSFLTKQGPLTDQEYRRVQDHPRLGAEKLGNHPRLDEVRRWVSEHHERFDGRGYPEGKRADEISLPGRILCVVEVFDSLATKRSYKKAWELPKVLEYFDKQREKAFDPDVLDAFLARLERHGDEWIAQPQKDRAGLAKGSVDKGSAANHSESANVA